jgi:hypothetical protein
MRAVGTIRRAHISVKAIPVKGTEALNFNASVGLKPAFSAAFMQGGLAQRNPPIP